jgi:hypothetical protein
VHTTSWDSGHARLIYIHNITVGALQIRPSRRGRATRFGSLALHNARTPHSLQVCLFLPLCYYLWGLNISGSSSKYNVGTLSRPSPGALPSATALPLFPLPDGWGKEITWARFCWGYKDGWCTLAAAHRSADDCNPECNGIPMCTLKYYPRVMNSIIQYVSCG